jgi:cell division septum initiation protein DivIVA
MNDEDNPGCGADVRERIASLLRANAQAPKKPITAEEQQRLKNAANRLDQMLKVAADADAQVLKSAAARLDHLLKDISRGKNIGHALKRHRESPKQT